MKDVLAIIAFLLILVWVVGIFAFAAVLGSFIHIILVLAVVIFVFRYIKIRNEKSKK